jgi:hypothetical protein
VGNPAFQVVKLLVELMTFLGTTLLRQSKKCRVEVKACRSSDAAPSNLVLVLGKHESGEGIEIGLEQAPFFRI